MRASPFYTHSIEGSTVGYARIQMLSAGHIASLRDRPTCVYGTFLYPYLLWRGYKLRRYALYTAFYTSAVTQYTYDVAPF